MTFVALDMFSDHETRKKLEVACVERVKLNLYKSR
jgi:hypothetical protein